MIANNLSEQVYKKTLQIFKSGLIEDRLVKEKGNLENPLPITDLSDNKIVAWFIGISVENKLAGFIQLSSTLEFLRYSSFQRIPQSLEGCPNSSVWLNPDVIIQLEKVKAAENDILSSPILTFDQNLSRIVWAVNVESKKGLTKTIYVAGEYVYIKKRNN
jgi:hypothetical protein